MVWLGGKCRHNLGIPGRRDRAAMTYDSIRERVVLFGGFNGVNLSDTWEWDGDRWIDVTPSTNNPPAADVKNAMAFDTVRGVTVMFTGSQTWTWDGTSWTNMTPASNNPSTNDGRHALIFDDRLQQAILHSGTNTWAWDGAQWRDFTLSSSSPRPVPDNDSAVVYDSIRQKTVLVDEEIVWELSGNVWEDVTPSNIRPPAGKMAYDVSGNQVFIVWSIWREYFSNMGVEWTAFGVT